MPFILPGPTQTRNSGRAEHCLVVQRQRRWNRGGCPVLGSRLSGKRTHPSYQIFFRERRFTGVRVLGLYFSSRAISPAIQTLDPATNTPAITWPPILANVHCSYGPMNQGRVNTYI